MARHPYRRLRSARPSLPEVGISEEGAIRSLHLGSATIQSSMNVDCPSELVLSYSRAMMAWLLFVPPPQHITQIGLGGGSFARWIDAYLPEARQIAVEINPQVISVARGLFELPFEGERFEVVAADGADYMRVCCAGSTDVILVDGFDGEQIVDDLVTEAFFADCRQALSDEGVFVTNWWQGDKRYPVFVQRLGRVFDCRVLAVPAATHGNVAVLAFNAAPKRQSWEKWQQLAQNLENRYRLDFSGMLAAIRAQADNQHGLIFA